MCNSRRIRPCKSFRGELSVPGDKSISHRSLLLGSLARGETEIKELSSGEDVKATVRCLRSLGISIDEKKDGNVLTLRGRGIGGYSTPRDRLDAGNSGTLMRLMAGILSGHPFSARLDGDRFLRDRPMERIIEPLSQMGANITSASGYPPLRIEGGDLRGIEYTPQIPSAQVKSCVLLAGLHARGKTTVVEPGPSRDHTERMLDSLGYPVIRADNRITVHGPKSFDGFSITVPGDLSSASFFLAAGSVIPGSKVRINGVGINQTRKGFLNLLVKMGASVKIINRRETCGEPVGDVEVTSSDLQGISVRGEEVVRAIDELPLLAVIATQANGETRVRDAEELRVKETDRIKAIVTNLSRMGATIDEKRDGFIIEGPVDLKGGKLKSFGDHRIAMAFAIGGLFAKNPCRIERADWVRTSYPGFFEQLDGLRNG